MSKGISIVVIYIMFVAMACVLSVVGAYFIKSLFFRKLRERKINKVLRFMGPHFALHMSEFYIDDAPELGLDINKMMSAPYALEAFARCYGEYAAKNGYTEKARQYASKYVEYAALLKCRTVRNKYRTSFILRMLAEYRINTAEANSLAFRNLSSKSLYARESALAVIGNAGDPRLVARALNEVSGGPHYYSEKLLVDFLDAFAGAKSDLSKALLEGFDSFGIEAKRIVAVYFANCKDGSASVRGLMLSCAGSLDMELAIRAIRYFGWVTDPAAAGPIIKGLDHEYWEIRAVSARVCKYGYGGPEALEAVGRRIYDQNWHVSVNSAYAFTALADAAGINKIVCGGDRQAGEIVMYVMLARGMIDYGQYAMKYPAQARAAVKTAAKKPGRGIGVVKTRQGGK